MARRPSEAVRLVQRVIREVRRACLLAGMAAGAACGLSWGDGAAMGQPAPPIVNAAALTPWIVKAETGRADMIALGDSNQVFDTTGWDHGMTRALAQRFGTYSTGLLAVGENFGQGAGLGYLYQAYSLASSMQFAFSGAPAGLEALLTPGVIRPMCYARVAAGAVAGGSINTGMFMWRDAPVNPAGTLRYLVTFGRFTSGVGSFQPTIRQGEPPYTVLAISAKVFTSGATESAATASVMLAPGPRTTALDFRLTPWQVDIEGPFIGYYQRVENMDAQAGAAMHTLHAVGGDSARDMALGLLTASDAQLELYLGLVRSLQKPPVRVLVRINSGLNDRNEPLVSLGPTPTLPGNSAAAYADNMLAIIGRIETVWQDAGWDVDELCFLISVSHPVANPDDTRLRQYRAAAAGIAATRKNVAVTNFDRLTAAGEMQISDWYNSDGFDVNHLTRAGYENLAQRELLAMEAGTFWRDLNRDRRIDVEDLYQWHESPQDFSNDFQADVTDWQGLTRAVRAGEVADTMHSR